MGPLQPQSVRRLLDRRMELTLVGQEHVFGRLLSVSGGMHPTLWLTEVDREETDVVVGLDRVLEWQLAEDRAQTMRFRNTPMPSTLDSMMSPAARNL